MNLTSGDDLVTPDLTYKDYRFVVSEVGKGWPAMIYVPRSSTVLRESPTNLEQSWKEAIIAAAKWIGDAVFDPANAVIEQRGHQGAEVLTHSRRGDIIAAPTQLHRFTERYATDPLG